MSQSSSGIDGVSIRHYPDSPEHARRPWLGRAKDAMGRWKGKWFTTQAEALKWATNTSRGFAKGGAATRVRMSDIGPAYCARLTGRDGSQAYKDMVDNVWQALVRAGLDDVSHPSFAARFESWVTKLSADWWVTPEERAKPTPSVQRALLWAAKGKPPANNTKDAIVRCASSIINRMAVLPSTPLLTHNPLRSVERFQKDKDKVIRPCFSVEEIRQLVRDDMRDHPFWLAACLAAYNPRRTAEAMHLRWEWINWDAMSVKMVNIPELKAANVGLKSGETSWPLEPELRDILLPLAKPHGWILDNARLRCGAGWDIVRDKHYKGRPSYTRAFAAYYKAAGIEAGVRTAYNLRHTGITIRLAMGISENLVAAYAAHSDPGVTLEHYGRERAQFSHRVKHWGGRLYFRDDEPKALKVAN